MATIPRSLPSKSLREWSKNKPCMPMVAEHMERVIRSAPIGWQVAVRQRLTPHRLAALGSDTLDDPPEWVVAWDMLQTVADFEDRFGMATVWNLEDTEICQMAKKLAAEAEELDALCLGQGDDLDARVDSIRMLIRCVGIEEDKPITGEPAIKRAQDAGWWRRRLRRHVARMVEAGAVAMGLVHRGTGGYISADGMRRRQAQIKRNSETLGRVLYKNEAGQVYRLGELAALGTANPAIRGGELMTRIRGAEEYADERAHVGLFVTMTCPGRFHPMRLVGKDGAVRNPNFTGETPRDCQLWLRDKWQRTRAALARKKVRMYGLRVAEPHHDATPHWHMLLWAENEAAARVIEEQIRHYWLLEHGDEKGAVENRVNVKRLTKGGAASYVAKYIAKSVGHMALSEHMDVVNGEQITMDFGGTDAKKQETNVGSRRVDAWAAHWGIRQFQTFGMPSVTVWRELRRVSGDQLELFAQEGDRATVRAHMACHRHGDIRADWRIFMESMGGHACHRSRWHLRTAHRTPEVGAVNRYGEEVKVGRIVGLCAQQGRMRGRWLVSRRIAWSPLVGDEVITTEQNGAADEGESGIACTALPGTWSGFNNCTARITHELWNEVVGHGAWEMRDENTPEPVIDVTLYREAMRREAMKC